MTWLKSNFVYLFWIVAAICYYWFFIHRTNLLQQRGKYTVGYVTGRIAGGKSMGAISYRCRIGGVIYNGSSGEEQGMEERVGTPYLVEYDSLDPSENQAYFDRPLPAAVGSPPPNGWTKKAFEALATEN